MEECHVISAKWSFIDINHELLLKCVQTLIQMWRRVNCFFFCFLLFFFYIWLDFYRQAQFHVTTPQRVIRLCIIANSAAHTSPGCVHSNSCRRSSPGGSLTIRAGHCIAMPHDPDTCAALITLLPNSLTWLGEPVAYGKDTCQRCRMEGSNPRPQSWK